MDLKRPKIHEKGLSTDRSGEESEFLYFRVEVKNRCYPL